MPQPNDHLGPYILIQKLGSGQFGVVWKAQRRYGIAPPCAIKLPTDHEIKWEDVEKEARVWMHASGHPNVLPMIEANVYDGQIALVSEYAVDGSLLDWLRKHGGKAPSVEKAVEIMSSILAGLEHLHRRNIIHRDLKPANILLQGDIPRLADFGLSRVLSSTQSTTPAGTLAYMSPEAFNGERNAQTDIWAAGVILYQLLTGRLPFPQRDMASLMNAILMKLPESLPPDLPEPLRSTVMRALEKTWERRYESAAVMRESLLRINAAPQPQSRAVSPLVPIISDPAQYIAPRDVENGLKKPPDRIVLELETEIPKLERAASPANKDRPVAGHFKTDEKQGINRRTIMLISLAAVLALSLSAVYLIYSFTQDRSASQQQLQGENHQLIQTLRARIGTLRTRANAKINAQLNILSQRLDEAAAMPTTKYQQIGQACTEVENAISLLEQNASGPKSPIPSPSALSNAKKPAVIDASATKSPSQSVSDSKDPSNDVSSETKIEERKSKAQEVIQNSHNSNSKVATSNDGGRNTPHAAPNREAHAQVELRELAKRSSTSKNASSNIFEATAELKPNIISKEKAKYTEGARQNRVQGTVVLSLVFNADGRVSGARVIRGLPDGLNDEAIKAAQKIKFWPAIKNGQPVSVRMPIEFTFNLL